MNILFASNSEIALKTLDVLSQHFHLVGVLTKVIQAPGNSQPKQNPIAQMAQQLGYPVLSFPSLKAQQREQVKALKADIMLVFSYGQIFGPLFLELFAQGAYNIHPSLLPDKRGACPLEQTILDQDQYTGISIQKMALKMDEGDIGLQKRWPLEPQTTIGELYQLTAGRAAVMAVEFIHQLEKGSINFKTQDHNQATYTKKWTKQDGWIDWHQSVYKIAAQIRAFQKWPKTYTYWNKRQLIIHQATAMSEQEYQEYSGKADIKGGWAQVIDIKNKQGLVVKGIDGILILEKVQLEGKKMMDGYSFALGAPGLENYSFMDKGD